MIFEYTNNSFDLYVNYIIICLSSYWLSAFVFCKTQSIKCRINQLIFLLITGMVLSVLFAYVRMNNYPLSQLLRYVLIPVFLSILARKNNPLFKSLVVGLISLTFVSALSAVSYFIISTFSWSLKLSPDGILVYLPCEIFTLLLCVCFMKIKRFRKGIQFFQQEKNLGLGLLISSVVMVLKTLNLRENQDTDYYFVIAVFGAIIAGFGLYLWIRRSISAHYRERLQLKSEEHYKELLEDRDKEIEKLHQSNEYLAKVVHRDNHLMNAVNTSVNAYFDSDKKEDKDRLLRDLQTLTKERADLINQELLQSKLLPSTGNLLIDSVINDLYIKAAAHGIDFNLTVSSTVDEIIGKYLSQTDLQTLLSDHIKDAIIAVESRGEVGGNILVNLSKQNDEYAIDIYDNGIEFNIDTLSKLGLERVTTHSDTGGSGIGFMTTFETLKKAYASFIITEFENRMPFSKSVTFRFDGENVYIIHSYRSEELKKNINRADLVIDN